MTTQELKYRFSLDTFKNGMQRVQQGFQTGENVVRKMEISLTAGAESYEIPLSNITASMYVKRPSQTEPSINACSIDAANNKIIYTVLPEDIAEAGIVEMQLKLIDSRTGSDVVLVAPKFGLEIWESLVDDSEAESTPTYTSLTEALAAATAMKDTSIADLYIDDDNVFTVVFGDGTIYTSDVIADAIGRIVSVETNALKAEGYAVGKQNGVEVEASSPYYENNAKYYSNQAGTSASNAAASASAASASESNAATSENNAATSESNALSYKNAAATSESNAAASESAAATSETNAAASESAASASAAAALASEQAAATSETNAASSESAASTSETNAAASETAAGNYATSSRSYAVGGTGTRQGEDNDNAKHYKEVCEQIAGALQGGFIPMGTIVFVSLPTASADKTGWMYNISDQFTSDSRFKDGGGKVYPSGTNVYLTADLMWDCMSGEMPMVNGKRGNSITLDGSDILVSGYTKAAAQSAISTSDTFNQALGKLEKKADDINSSFSPKSDIVNNLTSTDTNKPLSANQGKELKTLVDGKVATADIVNNLTSTDTNKPLSAAQGKALKTLADANTAALGGISFVTCTAAEYEAITVKEPNTLYIIVPEE